MKFDAAAVSADFTDNAVTVAAGIVIHCLTDIAEEAPGLDLLKTELNAFLRYINKLLLFRADVADAVHSR